MPPKPTKPTHPLTVQGVRTIEQEENVERFEALASAKIRIVLAIEQARDAHGAVSSTGLAPAHILEPLRTVVALLEQSRDRVDELLTRVPL